jgi:C-terminal processing protease CtpA/Prc
MELVERLRALVEEHYVFPEVAATVSRRLAAGRYPSDLPAFAEAVTADLQADSHDKHLRLVHHDEPVPASAPGDDAEEYAAMRRWAARTGSGVAALTRAPGNVAVLDLSPVLFPSVFAADRFTAALMLVADSDALVVDLRRCLGGDPSTVAFVISYLWDHEPAQLTGLRDRAGHTRQSWTQPYVPGRRYGKERPVYVLTSATTFSGGEQLAYDLQRLGRATVVGEQTRGGANAREAFRLHPHLEATIPVVTAVHPTTGTNWEGVGVTPDVVTTASEAQAVALRLAAEAGVSSTCRPA